MKVRAFADMRSKYSSINLNLTEFFKCNSNCKNKFNYVLTLFNEKCLPGVVQVLKELILAKKNNSM